MPDKKSSQGHKPAQAKDPSKNQNATLEQMGTDDTQSEFSVSEARSDAAEEEQREQQQQQNKPQNTPQQSAASDAKPGGSGRGTDDTQSEFSVEKRLREEK